ncbi:class I adenylate-forming enzyme family protein [Rhizobium alvei]|uniref:Class I adenylate-forming enzyme family protein n=2 Tax=Rhizobium alvei TaxID=1132659 RepID=A0ABT8YJC5_9HYPH|nr:class I adenylate-forming enzyme family protein [Rhizobium alvei]MDO6963384.1 class I adenylate-forming enzyme family protein [Rhizobium alvei]
MAGIAPGEVALQRETHFGDRSLLCLSPRPQNMRAIFDAAVRSAPDREAVRDVDRALTYAALDREAEQFASALRAAGLQAGDRIALNTGNRIEFVVGLVACFKAGFIAMPVGHRHRRAELGGLYRDAGVSAVLCDAETAAEQPDQIEVPSLGLRIGVGVEVEGGTNYAAFLATGKDARPFGAPAIDEDACAVLMYTSGTTGRPKGAKITHLGMVHSVLHYQMVFELAEGEATVLAVPCTHVTGLGAQILVMFGCAGTLIMMPHFETTRFVELATEHAMTYTIMVPAMYALLLHRQALKAGMLPDWRIGAFGGAPMPEAIKQGMADMLPRLSLHNAYGATETTSPTTLVPLGTSVSNDSVGRAVPCGELRIVDEEGRDVGEGEQGELWIKGPMVVPGYWQNPEADAASFEQGYWKSGDVASRDADGFIRIHDRKKDMINRGGYKIFSAEIENLLMEMKGVREAALVPYPCAVLGERGHMFVVAGDGNGAVTADDLRAFLAARVADYKVPDRFTIRSEPLPRNVNGKLVKTLLRQEAMRDT